MILNTVKNKREEKVATIEEHQLDDLKFVRVDG